ncbi:MAG TPA: helix-turn-helix domain-containing protein [Symbiobacteriaceae bacterium]|nr:helix-turn-helix domain-containing protein [Symbiobacteriaceae bacterium]
MSEGLSIYAVGDFGPRDRWNPEWLVSSLNAWPVLRVLAPEPAPLSTLAEETHLPASTIDEKLSSLTDLGIVSRAGNKIHLGFAWFTQADQDLIHASVIQTAHDLADRILARRNEIDRYLAAVKASDWVDLPDLRFAVVGCFGLDWGALDALKASGHLEHNKEQPGGRRYVMYVEEPVERYQQRDYTGSHTTWINEAYQWTSFGDHSGPRYGLPDLLWHLRSTVLRSERLPAESRAPLGDLVLDAVSAQLDLAAEELIRVATGTQAPPAKHPLLAAANAVGQERPTVPVFFWDADGSAIDGVVNTVKDITVSTVSDRFDHLRTAMSDLTALRHGVPFTECFNPIWHALFGHVNRLLAEAGYLADPAPRHPGEGRYRWWLTVRSPDNA